MSANVMIEIVCDICRESETEWGTTLTRLRAHLKDDGWQRRKGEDICPHCIRNEVV